MSFGSRKEIAKKIIESKEYRDAYSWTYLKKSIPFQIRTMRTERDWSQVKAGEILGKPQNVISRLESPAYSKLTLQTLVELAKGFDAGLIIKFVPYSRLLREYEDVSFSALSAPSPTKKFKDEIEAILKWADEDKEEDGFWEEKVDTHTNVLTSPAFASEPILQPKKGHYSLNYITEVKTENVTSNEAVSVSGVSNKQEKDNSNAMAA